MSINSTHPDYDERLIDWLVMSDTHAGERHIKEQGPKYLAATIGMIADGMNLNEAGQLAYQSYKMRSRFPDSVSVAVKALVGLLHTKPPTIELPTSMEPLRENATNLGESLALHRNLSGADDPELGRRYERPSPGAQEPQPRCP